MQVGQRVNGDRARADQENAEPARIDQVALLSGLIAGVSTTVRLHNGDPLDSLTANT
jgi:hypothetical protein